MYIQVLDEDTVNKIAAGEVIERPMAVVKELMENAIDSGASIIAVEIKDGGKSMVRVTDNGSGIDEEDIKLAFAPHATSKIKQFKDLLSVSTLGFRGEALASISAVSQLEMLTKTADAFNGSRYVIEGGNEKKLEAAGCPDGTTFIVRNLFYNTPARLKFLKTVQTEAGYISSLVEHMALSHPEISFSFINQNQPKLHTSGNGNIKDVIYNIYGRDITSGLLHVNIQTESCIINGYIGKPAISRGNRSYINYFINGRYIKSNIINKAVEEAYAPYMMQHKYPFVILHFVINPQFIDINVHPQKMELRFTNEKELYKDIYDTIRETLKYKELIPEVEFGKEIKNKTGTKKYIPGINGKEKNISASRTDKHTAPYKVKNPASGKAVTLRYPSTDEINSLFTTSRTEDTDIQAKDNSSLAGNSLLKDNGTETQPSLREHAAYNAYNTRQGTLFDITEETNIMSPIHENEIKIIGQVFSTYWILQYGDDMFMIDQHAAHEKVLYERLVKQIEQNKTLTQMVNPPFVLSLSMAGQQALEENIGIFEKLGYCIENFGGREYMVSGVPAQLPGVASPELVLEIIDGITDNKISASPQTLIQKIATMSCRAAVKGGKNLPEEQAHELLKELMSLENPYNCPHGRPTMIKMAKREIEKKFKRIL